MTTNDKSRDHNPDARCGSTFGCATKEGCRQAGYCMLYPTDAELRKARGVPEDSQTRKEGDETCLICGADFSKPAETRHGIRIPRCSHDEPQELQRLREENASLVRFAEVDAQLRAKLRTENDRLEMIARDNIGVMEELAGQAEYAEKAFEDLQAERDRIKDRLGKIAACLLETRRHGRYLTPVERDCEKWASKGLGE